MSVSQTCLEPLWNVLITERHADKSKDLFTPAVIVEELPILQFCSTPVKLIGTQKAWK